MSKTVHSVTTILEMETVVTKALIVFSQKTKTKLKTKCRVLTFILLADS